MGSQSEACTVDERSLVFIRCMFMNTEGTRRVTIRANYKPVSESVRLSVEKISVCQSQSFFSWNEGRQ